MRPARLTLAAALLGSLSLAACNNPDAGRTGGASRICTPFPEAAGAANTAAGAPAPAVQPAADPSAALDDCLHRWSYSLAAASDRAGEVAQAAVAGCTPALARWNQQGLTTGAAGAQPGEAQTAPSLLTGQPTNPLAEHYTYAQARALFYVVQARAGKCAPPPATTTNTGVTPAR